MKIISFVILIFGICFVSLADSLRLAGITYQPPASVEIAWNVPTNELPSGLWVYKVTPQYFSMAVVSNAMAIGGFQLRDIINPRDTNVIQFRDKKNVLASHRSLTISPTLGWIQYNDRLQAKGLPEDVPNDEEAIKLAQDYLFQLGIDLSQFASKPKINPTTQIELSQGQELPEKVVRREVVFNRCIDGVEQTVGSFRITFGSHAKVEAFDLSWRNLLPFESHQPVTVNGIVDFIKSGQAVIPLPEFDFTQLAQTKKLTVTKITPYYYGAWASNSLDFLYPFAQLEMTADLGNTNFNFQLRCPILSTNVFKIQTQIK